MVEEWWRNIGGGGEREEWKITKVAAFKYSKGISSLDGPILFEVYLD